MNTDRDSRDPSQQTAAAAASPAERLTEGRYLGHHLVVRTNQPATVVVVRSGDGTRWQGQAQRDPEGPADAPWSFVLHVPPGEGFTGEALVRWHDTYNVGHFHRRRFDTSEGPPGQRRVEVCVKLDEPATPRQSGRAAGQVPEH